jgi:hypothetical protein
MFSFRLFQVYQSKNSMLNQEPNSSSTSFNTINQQSFTIVDSKPNISFGCVRVSLVICEPNCDFQHDSGQKQQSKTDFDKGFLTLCLIL